MTMRRLAMAMTMAAMLVLTTASAALAGGGTDQAKKEAAGWGCAAAVGLPGGHCISPGTRAHWPDDIIAKGRTFQLQVFDENGAFLTAEIATFKASADGRACPHDPKATDGTYWEFVPGLYVCHHQPAG
jgi:hypothetical protein